MTNNIHKHEQGEILTSFFVGVRNKDSTEGRGPIIDVGAFRDHMDAFSSIRGAAPMGAGDGDVVRRAYYRCKTCPEFVKEDVRIYVGDNYSKKNLIGRGAYVDFMPDGWHKNYSPMAQDPEWEEYLRLQKKFT